jgi:hypothetical protein
LNFSHLKTSLLHVLTVQTADKAGLFTALADHAAICHRWLCGRNLCAALGATSIDLRSDIA